MTLRLHFQQPSSDYGPTSIVFQLYAMCVIVSISALIGIGFMIPFHSGNETICSDKCISMVKYYMDKSLYTQTTNISRKSFVGHKRSEIEYDFHEKYELKTEKSMEKGLGVAWLMSFPNSGTSYTLNLVREASNKTTATNYALEGEIKDQPSVPAISSSSGGPFLEIIPNRTTDLPSRYILTKTHCG